MYIGVDVGGSHIGAGLLDDDFNIIKEEDIYISKEMPIDDIIENIKLAIKRVINDEVKYIGIGFPGVCNTKTGKIVKASNLKYNDYCIPDIISKEFNIPVYIDNDANCAVIAEHYKGSLKKVENGVLLTIGTGIGSGIIINNKIYRGAHFSAGELGHMILEKNGIECGCGQKGCFERYSALSVLKRAMNCRKIEVEQLEEIFNNNDERLIDIYNNWIEDLSNGIVSIYNILDPDKIVLGGGICKIFEYIKPTLIHNIEQKKNNSDQEIVIEKAILQNDAGMIGAGMLGIV